MSSSSSARIHPTAVVEDGAVIGEDVEIGPLCHVGPQVVLGAGARLVSHVALHGRTDIGERTRIFPFASIGHEPQDLKYAGEPVSLHIGADCTLREGVTVNPGTAGDKGRTIIGDRCTLLANSHVAHDCTLGRGVILSNNVMIAGHCTIGDYVIFGGGSAIHQFCHVGRNAFIGGLAGVEGDLLPFGMALGNRARLQGLNIVGMKRLGIPREKIHAARSAYKSLFAGDVPVKAKAAELAGSGLSGPAQEIVEFIVAAKDRSLCSPG